MLGGPVYQQATPQTRKRSTAKLLPRLLSILATLTHSLHSLSLRAIRNEVYQTFTPPFILARVISLSEDGGNV